jgi:hypothetical protein
MQSEVAGTATERIPDVAVSDPSSVPWDQSRKVHADPVSDGMANVARVGEMAGEWTTEANVGAPSATATPPLPRRMANRSARRPVRCWRVVSVPVEASDYRV